jgi:TRAP-type uncharacterized transport system substrate-binding protein
MLNDSSRIEFGPVIQRSRLVLEMASEMVGEGDFPYKQVRVQMREQGGEEWTLCLFASDAPAAIQDVASGAAQVAIINPGAVVAMAYHGVGAFSEPVPLRAILVMPQFDRLAFMVSERTGLTSLEEIRERKFPLRVSVRGQRDHAVHLVTDLVLATAGFSLDDIIAWGGEVHYDPGLPQVPGRIGAAERGEIDAIFDEALRGWGSKALKLGFRFLSIEGELLEKLEAMGLRRNVISRDEDPLLKEDITTLDFSGWPVVTRLDVPDDIITSVCRGLEARRDLIPSYARGPLPVDLLCKDSPEAPLPIPLHPAAERYWRAQGYLD